MNERKPVVWNRFKWLQSEKDGEVTIQPYDEFPSHVTCPRCGKNTDYNLWNQGGCFYCSDLDKWQERQDKIDEWFLQDENNLYDMRDCSLISDYEFLKDNDISVKFRCTWIETGEKVVLTVQQVGQGIPHWKVIAVCEEEA